MLNFTCFLYLKEILPIQGSFRYTGHFFGPSWQSSEKREIFLEMLELIIVSGNHCSSELRECSPALV